MYLKHTDDDGDLSIFASGKQILLACNKGHYWTLTAAQASVEKRARDEEDLASLKVFGPNLEEALGLRE